jgi:hypothetical protein
MPLPEMPAGPHAIRMGISGGRRYRTGFGAARPAAAARACPVFQPRYRRPAMPAISSRKPYRVGRSKTGLGLFATKPIKKGDVIIEYFGPLLDSRNEKHDAIENKYLFELNGRWTIDGSTRRNVARYINHACRPNAESDVQPRNRKVFIQAIKNIQPGDEINYDYGKEYFNEYLKPIGCKCAHCEAKRKLARAEARASKPGKAAKAGKAKAKSANTKSAKTKSAKSKSAKSKSRSTKGSGKKASRGRTKR